MHMLSPSPMVAPLYGVVRGEDGQVSIIEPPEELKQDIYAEVVLALLAHSVEKDLAKGSFEEFMGQEDLEACRITNLERRDDRYHAVYRSKDAKIGAFFLTFSEFKGELKDVDKTSGAVIDLEGDTKILVEVASLDKAPRTIGAADREELVMEDEIKKLVLGGDIQDAVEAFFTRAGFQDENIAAFAAAANGLLDEYMNKGTAQSTAVLKKGKAKSKQDKAPLKRNKAIEQDVIAAKENIAAFFRKTISYVAEFSDHAQVSADIQLMAGQALTIMSWRERHVYGAKDFRLTADESKMVKNDKRGNSFIDASSLSDETPEVKEEGAPGMYWRGVEKVKKLGDDIPEKLITDKERFEAAKDNLVLYLMDHGFLRVNGDAKVLTEKGKMSTIHETAFLQDRLPGTIQAASTGPGHFQGKKIDIKQVVEGQGIQFNVRYDEEGKIAQVMAHRVKAGDWTFALPGCVDYVVNLGGLRFNDLSVELDLETAEAFNPEVFEDHPTFNAVKTATEKAATSAPYLVASAAGSHYLVKNIEDAPEVEWFPKFVGHLSRMTGLLSSYNVLGAERSVDWFVETARETFEEALAPEVSGEEKIDMEGPFVDSRAPLEDYDAILIGEIEHAGAPSLHKADGIKKLIDENVKQLAKTFSDKKGRDLLVRIPVEVIESVGFQNAAGFLEVLNSYEKVYVELFSVDSRSQIDPRTYAAMGIKNYKKVPVEFNSSRENTITIFPVMKAEEITSKGKADGEWGIGDIRPTDTILMPVGFNYDKAGIIRSIIFGVKLSEIARQNKAKEPDFGAFLKEIYGEYTLFCGSQGVKGYNLAPEDLLYIATGDINKMVLSLNRLIASLPIVPLNVEEVRTLFEHARKTLVAA